MKYWPLRLRSRTRRDLLATIEDALVSPCWDLECPLYRSDNATCPGCAATYVVALVERWRPIR